MSEEKLKETSPVKKKTNLFKIIIKVLTLGGLLIILYRYFTNQPAPQKSIPLSGTKVKKHE